MKNPSPEAAGPHSAILYTRRYTKKKSAAEHCTRSSLSNNFPSVLSGGIKDDNRTRGRKK